MSAIFLHGLDSSSNGTKGRFFKNTFPTVLTPDFDGSLEQRLAKLEKICNGMDSLILVGSSFGGLMAACFAIDHGERVKRLVLMAPALNFPGFTVPKHQIAAPTYLLIGRQDIVTPPSAVLPLAEKTFANLEINLVDEDHLLHQSFLDYNWKELLEKG